MNTNSKMIVTVLGANGFIGAHLCTFLKKKGFKVRAVARKFSPQREELWQHADEKITANLLNFEETASALAGSNWVFHFAADMGGVEFFHNHNYQPFINNMRLDLNVFEACQSHNIERMFYASSACVYPVHLMSQENAQLHFSEEMIFPADADQMYGWGKLMSLLLAPEAPFDVRVGILHTVYGEYQDTSSERMKFPTAIAKKVIESKASGKPIEIWGNGKQLRTFCYIEDALEKIFLVMDNSKNHTPVNIGSQELVSVREVAELCCKIVEVEPKFTFNLEKPSGALSRGCDNTKFYKNYHYSDKYSLEEGFTRLITWMQETDFLKK